LTETNPGPTKSLSLKAIHLKTSPKISAAFNLKMLNITPKMSRIK